MCLEICRNKSVNTKKIKNLIKTNSENGLVFGYKHFRKNRKTGTITSTYSSSFIWQPSWNFSSRCIKRINEDELYDGEVNRGFHIFLNKKDALWDMHDFCETNPNFKYFVRKVWFKPEDLVAVGDFAGMPSAVIDSLYVRFD